MERDGEFRLQGLLPGIYLLRLEGQRPPCETHEVELWYELSGLVIRSSECTLVGVLERVPGAIDDTVHVSVTQWSPDRPHGGVYRSAQVSRDGTFEVSGLPAGPAWLSFISESEEPDANDGDAMDESGDPDDSPWMWLFAQRAVHEIDLVPPRTYWRGEMPRAHRLTIQIDAPGIDEPTRGTIRAHRVGMRPAAWDVELGTNGALRHLWWIQGRGGPQAIEDGRRGRALAFYKCVHGLNEITIDFSGYEPSSMTISIEGPTSIRTALQRQPGRWIDVKIPSRTWRLEARDEADGWRTLLGTDERENWRRRHRTGRARLHEGAHRLRLVSREFRTHAWDPLVVDDSATALVLSPRLDTGLVLADAFRSPRPDALEGTVLHLFRRAGGDAWARVPMKRATVERGRYAFRGLSPGTYRISPSESGTPVLAEAHLRDEDVRCDIDYGPSPDADKPPR